jgi:hypothetical protein
MNFIAALLLLLSGGNEVEVYYILLAIVERYGLKNLWAEGMDELKVLLSVFRELFRQQMPDLFNHFEQ